jgi:hypothetical protein
MTDVEVIEQAESSRHHPELRPAVEMNLFGVADPVVVVERATLVAKALADVIEQRNLYATISRRKHVVVEGWTLLGSMLGVFPVVEWTREHGDGWEARVIAVTRSGETVGAAEAMCSRSEAKWQSRDEYAIRSMAQTRATSKALRLPLGFVMTLAGYDATPVEEMDAATAAVAEQPFDPARALLPGAIWSRDASEMSQRLAEAMNGIDPTLDWVAMTKTLPGDRDVKFMRRLANAVEKITQEMHGSDVPPAEQVILDAFGWAFEGHVVGLVRREDASAATGATESDGEPEGDAPLGDAAVPAVDDDIAFGEDAS